MVYTVHQYPNREQLRGTSMTQIIHRHLGLELYPEVWRALRMILSGEGLLELAPYTRMTMHREGFLQATEFLWLLCPGLSHMRTQVLGSRWFTILLLYQ